MNEKEFMGIIFGVFVVLLLLVYGVFSDIMKTFVGSFGIGYGIILGVLFCLIIILSLIGGKKR